MAAKKREPFAVIERDYAYGFLPAKDEWDFLLVCTDKHHEAKISAGEEAPYFAFGLRSQDLRSASDFFGGMLNANNGTEMWLNAPEDSHVLSNLLSAAFEPAHRYLTRYGEWEDLVGALRLARKWQFERARPALFQAMLYTLLNEGDDIGQGLETREFFCEAAAQGEAALKSVEAVLRLRRQVGFPPLKLKAIGYPADYVLELGAERISEVAAVMFNLARDGALL